MWIDFGGLRQIDRDVSLLQKNCPHLEWELRVTSTQNRFYFGMARSTASGGEGGLGLRIHTPYSNIFLSMNDLSGLAGTDMLFCHFALIGSSMLLLLQSVYLNQMFLL